MTLNEKFEDAPIVYDDDLRFKKDYESICDELMIGFADWCDINNYFNYKSTKELLQMYKKEQGL